MRNFMKIYEQDFINLTAQRILTPRLQMGTTWTYAYRRELFNITNYTWSRRGNSEGYSPNAPESLELENTSFPNHYAFIGSATITYRPWLKYYIRNGRRYAIETSSPAFSLRYDQGFPAFNSGINFNRAEDRLSPYTECGCAGRFAHPTAGRKVFQNRQHGFYGLPPLYG